MIFFPSETTRKFRNLICDNYELILCDHVLEELRLVVDRTKKTLFQLGIRVFFFGALVNIYNRD